MWLIDYFKKNKTVSAGESADNPGGTSKEHPSVFKGDLALFQEASDYGNDKENTESHMEHSPADSDSSDKQIIIDCEIFMTFSGDLTDCWICSECGTYNEKQMTDCVVCGLKK